MRISQPNVLIMFIALNRSDILSVEPTFKVNKDMHLQLRVTSCVVEILVSAMKWVQNSFPKKKTTVANAFHWGGALYQSVHQHLEVSWEAAASYGQESGASLLTITWSNWISIYKREIAEDIQCSSIVYLGYEKGNIFVKSSSMLRCHLASLNIYILEFPDILHNFLMKYDW